MFTKKDKFFYANATDEFQMQNTECGGAVTAIIKFLLDKGIIDAALVLKEGSDIYDAVPFLAKSSEDLAGTVGSFHCGSNNIAKIIIKYLDGAKNLNLAVTTKPCESKTIMELFDKGKIYRDNLIMLGLNCGGTFQPATIRKAVEKYYKVNPNHVSKIYIEKGKLVIKDLKKNLKGIPINKLENNGYGRRSNCQRCEMNFPPGVDLAFGNWGVTGPDKGKKTFVEVHSQNGADILKEAYKKRYLNLEHPPTDGTINREDLNDSMIKLAKKWQDLYFSNFEWDILSFFELSRDFKNCIKCFGCREACPICYCTECNLEIPEWDEPGKIPPSSLFHIERLVHMVEYCTNCGQCEDACPMDIPLAKIWHKIHQSVNRPDFNVDDLF